MNVVILIPPNPDGRWIGREDKHAGHGRVTIPYTACQVHALIARDVPEARLEIIEAQRDGLDLSQVLARLDAAEPDLVICLMAWTHLKHDRLFAETRHPTIGVILQQFIDQREAVELYDLHCNWFTKQEFEIPLVEALKEFRDTGDIRATPGFLIRNQDGALLDTGNAEPCYLRSFPFPSFDAFEPERYFEIRKRIKRAEPRKIHLNTMKGCLFRCSFCGQANRGQGTRTQSVEQVMEQLRFFIERYGVYDFIFFDNEFGVDLKRAKGICREIIALGEPIRFEINNRVELFDAEFIDLLARAGCIGVRCGIETCDPVTQGVINKRIDLERAKQVFAAIKAAGIQVHLYMTPGIPGETRQTLEMNARFIVDSGADTYSSGALVLMPNSDFYNECKAKGLLLETDWDEYFKAEKLCFVNSSYENMNAIRQASALMKQIVEDIRQVQRPTAAQR